TLVGAAGKICEQRLAFPRPHGDFLSRLQPGLKSAEERDEQPTHRFRHLTDTDTAMSAALRLGRFEESRCRAMSPARPFSAAGVRVFGDANEVYSAVCQAVRRHGSGSRTSTGAPRRYPHGR